MSRLGVWTLLGFLKVLYPALHGVQCVSDKYFDPASWEWLLGHFVAEALLVSAASLWLLKKLRCRRAGPQLYQWSEGKPGVEPGLSMS